MKEVFQARNLKVIILASHPTALGLIPSTLKNISSELFDVAGIYRQSCSEQSGQRLENVNRTHLVLASGSLVRQKSN